MNDVNEEMRLYRPGHLFEDVSSDKSVLKMNFCIEGANFQKAGQASSKLKNNLLRIGLPPDATRRIAIASYEAEMNIVVFTPGGELRASIEPTNVTINAVDRGPGIPDVDVAMQPGYSTAPDWVRELGFGAGMGLPNIKNCSDELLVESRVGEGTTVQFTVHT
jgi:anti-sigma regulatory factor (Ser/Thr protein kinase)